VRAGFSSVGPSFFSLAQWTMEGTPGFGEGDFLLSSCRRLPFFFVDGGRGEQCPFPPSRVSFELSSLFFY